ncbi:NUDIX hydrolase [Microbispora rosea]|uniref:NUDIX hydrolase n=1 Tax=Microbispora rosea TaxID=58117 RepID=UPI0037955C10
MSETSALPRHSVSVTGVVVNDAGCVLAIKRADDGRWVPPGGVLELDETPYEGVVREVYEETGVKVCPDHLIGVYKNMKLGVVTLAIRCRVVEGTAHTSDEASSVRWLTLQEVSALMPEARAIRVIDAMRHDGPFVRVHDGTSVIPG